MKQRDEKGQAIVEYVLALAVAISIVSIIGVSFRKSIFGLWQTLTREVAAACPDCPKDPTLRIR